MTHEEGHLAQATVVVDADPEQCWRTLTDPELVEKYFFGTHVSCDWQVGSAITYSGEWDGTSYEDKGTVIAVEKPLRLVTSFFSPMSGKPDVPENYQTVTYRVQPVDGGCRVSVSQDNNESAEAAEHSSANWLSILEGLRKVAPTVR